MAKIDPEQEIRRLQTRFAAMNDLELQKVAKGYRGFTQWAFQVLSAEMERRGLDWPGRGQSWEQMEESLLGSEKDRGKQLWRKRASQVNQVSLLRFEGIGT